MQIGIPKEPFEGQTLVAASPDIVGKLIKLGYRVCVEEGAGVLASFDDAQYRAAGAEIVGKVAAWGADIVACLDTPPDEELALIKRGATLLARMNPQANPQHIKEFEKRGITALALDMVPRISRAQALDVRSSMMNVAGNRAVIEAANRFGRLFAGQVTAAGKVPPAKVYVIGVGVAGLAAIGAAGAMGAVVSATDVRSDVAEQVESLGGAFVEIPVKQESSDGYAKEIDVDQQQLVLEVYREQAAKSDVVITTAQIPGRPAPLLLDARAVAGMRPGSVIVDMGVSDLGSNCELTRPGEAYTTENGVIIIGYRDLPSRLPGQSSQLYGQNIVNLFKLVTPARDGVPVWNEEDEVIRGMMVTVAGKVMWPAPPVRVSAAPQKPAPDVVQQADELAKKPAWKKIGWKLALGALGIALILVAPPDMVSHFVVFELAVVVGFYVIAGVSHSLHTPLMSVTNAISGIIIVGAILLAGSPNPIVVALSFVAMTIASINVFGGFLVSDRMLKMFKRSSE